VFNFPRILCKFVCDAFVVRDDDIIYHLTRSYCPNFEADGSHALKIVRVIVFEVIGVWDFAWLPRTLVGRIWNTWWRPLSLVFRISNFPWLPLSTPNFLTFGIWYFRCFPFAVFSIVPVFGFLCLGVGDFFRFIVQPILRLLVVGVWNFRRFILVPIVGLLRIRIRNCLLVDPIRGFFVVGVVDFFGRHYGRLKVYKETAISYIHTININIKGIVFENFKSVKVSLAILWESWRILQMLLFIFFGDWIPVIENKMNFIGGAAFVRTKHDGVGRVIAEFR